MSKEQENIEKIRAAIDAVFNPEKHSIEEFPIDEELINLPDATDKVPLVDVSTFSEISDMKRACLTSPCLNETIYSLDWDVIRDLFEPKRQKLTCKLVVQRLALIDLFYSTNMNQFSQFVLYELACAIIGLSTNANGCSDCVLAAKAQDFVKNPSKQHDIYTKLFGLQYGYQFNKKVIPLEKRSAVSIISKYLYFLLEAQGCQVGFPIYDSIVKDLLPGVSKKIGINIKAKSIKNIVPYVIAIKNVANTLNVTHRVHKNIAMSRFAVLDYFLWRIGKVGDLSFSLLITRDQLVTYSKVLAIIKYINGLKPQPKNKYQQAYKYISQLPSRFLLWWHIYHFIK